MKDETPSRTAAWVAAARGLGMLLPSEIRIADDPYGMAFVDARIAGFIERRRPRAITHVPALRAWIMYMQVRTRLLDDAVRLFVEEGGHQLVLLGAGYDCRAIRLPELADARVFEVDHPATQKHKKRVLQRLDKDSPSTYVTWHFERQPMAELGDALRAAGHDPTKPTLTIWEGVTMYLTEGAIDTSLRAIRGWTSPGGQLAMTYFAKSRIEAPNFATRAVQALVSRVGEPWKFGWDPATLGDYLAKRGFELDADIAMNAAAQQLLPPAEAALVGADDRRIAIAGASAEAIALATSH